VDLFREPRAENLRETLEVRTRLGFQFEAGGEPFAGAADDDVLEQVIRAGARISAIHETVDELDLMLSIAGFGFEDLRGAATPFRIAETEIRVGGLEQLLRSKKIAGRPRDRAFLRSFAARAEDEDET